MHRNSAWEGACLGACNRVEVGGALRRPWLTWFIDQSTRVVTGGGGRPGPSDAHLGACRGARRHRALRPGRRACLTHPRGVGPALARGTLGAAMAVFGVEVLRPPACAPGEKSVIETADSAVIAGSFHPIALRHRLVLARAVGGSRFGVRCLHRRGLGLDRRVERSKPRVSRADGLAPLEAWTADRTPITDVADGQHGRMPPTSTASPSSRACVATRHRSPAARAGPPGSWRCRGAIRER